MRRRDLPLAFLAGAFAANAIPHLAKGLTGQTHQTPRRAGDTAVANTVWGWANAAIAAALWCSTTSTTSRLPAAAAFAAGSLTLGVPVAATWARHPERNVAANGPSAAPTPARRAADGRPTGD